MKKTLLLLVTLLGITGVYLHWGTAKPAKNEVVVFNWSDYIPQEVLNDFTRETGINVVYSTYESNESMFAKIQLIGEGKHGYDVTVPSTYYINMLRAKELIQEWDMSRLGNLKNIDDNFLDQDYDPGNRYSIPYMWGALGILVNKNHIDPAGIRSWSDLHNPDFAGSLLLSDDLRDMLGIALKSNGLSPNSASEQDLRQALSWLLKLKPLARVFSTEVKQPFSGGETHIGVGWNGDALALALEHPEITFIWPREGSLIWVDSFVLLKGAPNAENAHTFVNYMLRPEVAAKCVAEYMYSTPNRAALALLEKELRQNKVFMPPAAYLNQSEYLLDLGPAMRLYSEHWEKFLGAARE